MNKSIIIAFAAAVALMGAGCTGYFNSNNSTTPPSANQGKVIFSVTDAAADMSGVTSVQMTVDKIEMHSAANGWVTVSNDVKTFDLLALKAQGALAAAADVNVAEGTYNQIRLHVQKVAVVKSGVEAEAKLPSNNLEVTGTFTVTHDSTTSVKLDFLADESFHITGNGKFIFAPVVKTESRTNADVSVAGDDKVVVSGGSVESDSTEGMDVDGTMRDGFKLEAGEKLEINDDDTIHLGTSSAKSNGEAEVKVKVGL